MALIRGRTKSVPALGSILNPCSTGNKVTTFKELDLTLILIISYRLIPTFRERTSKLQVNNLQPIKEEVKLERSVIL